MPETFQYQDPVNYDDLDRTRQLHAAAMQFDGVKNVVIVPQTAKMEHMGDGEYYPVSLDLLRLNQAYIGSTSQIWDSDKAPDTNGNHISQNLYDVQYVDVSATYNQNRSEYGSTYVLDYDHQRVFYPSLRNVNEDITVSPMYFSFAIATIVHIAYGAWKNYVGSNMTEEQYNEKTADYVNKQIAKRFDNRFQFEVSAYASADDRKRKYSWTTEIDVYTNGRRTVNKLNIFAVPKQRTV